MDSVSPYKSQVRLTEMKKSLVNKHGGRRIISTKYYLTKADVRDILMIEGRTFYIDFRTEASVLHKLVTEDIGFGVYEVYLRKA